MTSTGARRARKTKTIAKRSDMITGERRERQGALRYAARRNTVAQFVNEIARQLGKVVAAHGVVAFQKNYACR